MGSAVEINSTYTICTQGLVNNAHLAANIAAHHGDMLVAATAATAAAVAATAAPVAAHKET